MDLKDIADINNFETSVIEIIKDILGKKEKDFMRLGIQTKLGEIRKYHDINNKYTSEIEINFWSGNKFIDVLEFFIYFQGKQNATLSEIELWLDKSINNIIKQQN
jgi:hypothetical protein